MYFVNLKLHSTWRVLFFWFDLVGKIFHAINLNDSVEEKAVVNYSMETYLTFAEQN